LVLLSFTSPAAKIPGTRVKIDRRFCGPPESGNGGYVCGRAAAFLEGDVEVTLRRPPPLGTPLDVVIHGHDRVSLSDESGLVAEGRRTKLNLTVPFVPSFDEALRAAEAYTGFREHFYPTCFVCGPNRKTGDGLRIFAGPLPGNNCVAAPWIPHRSLGDDTGRVNTEYVWAALDCPGYFAINRATHGYMLLGRLAAAIRDTPNAGDRCVIVGWPIQSEGRKHQAATALLSESGEVLGRSLATWIELKRQS
jgi:hypothetical protein